MIDYKRLVKSYDFSLFNLFFINYYNFLCKLILQERLCTDTLKGIYNSNLDLYYKTSSNYATSLLIQLFSMIVYIFKLIRKSIRFLLLLHNNLSKPYTRLI